MNRRNFLKGLASLVLAGNTLFNLSSNAQEITNVEEHEPIIERAIEYYNSRLGFAPPKNLVKAMIEIETGTVPYAFKVDPMSIAHLGDPALDCLKRGKENTKIIGDFNFLNDVNPAPRKNGKWDYSNSNMTPEKSIFGGIGWLLNYAANMGHKYTESGDIKEYKVVKGDNYEKIAKKFNTHVETLIKYNPSIKPEKLRVGQIIKFRESKRVVYVKSLTSWEDALKMYNGGGDPTYVERVMGVKEQLDKKK